MKKIIMHVEDDEDTRQGVKFLLEKEGYEMLEAKSGEECLKKLEKKKPDLILLDIMMPGMSGYDTFKKVKKNTKWKNIGIIFLSIVEISPERLKNLKKEGLKDYIVKPFEKGELIKRVKKAIK